MKKYSKKGLEKRKEERFGYADFFYKHVQNIKNSNACCAECGERLKGDFTEVAHILPKSYFKSISTNDLNVIYLCGMYCSGNNCHSVFDNSAQEKVKQMKIYPIVKERFQELLPHITEKLNYKHYDKYE